MFTVLSGPHQGPYEDMYLFPQWVPLGDRQAWPQGPFLLSLETLGLEEE